MNLQRRAADEDIEIDMSPMIDMVFLLLIFFIVASVIIDEKPKIKIPQAAYSKVPDDVEGRIMISVRNSGSETKDDEIFFEQLSVTVDELKDYMAIELEVDPNLQIFIRAGKAVKYKTNQKIMMACAEVGAVDLIYAAFEE
jgi:biopolymer transport protein ExbD